MIDRAGRALNHLHVAEANEFERPRQAGVFILSAGSVILEQMARIDASGEQRITLQARALSVGI